MRTCGTDAPESASCASASMLGATEATEPPAFDAAETFSWGVKNRPPGCSTLADERVERVHSDGGKQRVGVGQRRTGHNRNRRTRLGEFAGQPLETCRGDTGESFDLRRGVVRETTRPPIDQGPGATGGRRREQATRP